MTAPPAGLDPVRRYRPFSLHLREEFGKTLPKISIDPGTTCPNRDGTVGRGGCTFCYIPAFSAGDATLPVKDQILAGRERLKSKGKGRFLVYFQTGTTTHAPVETLRRWYRETLAFKETAGLIVGTRPDALPDPVIDLLGEVSRDHYLWVELGLQTIHSKTLALIQRRHGVEEFDKAMARLRNHPGIRIGVHLIVNLPGETLDDMTATIDHVADLKIDGVKLHPLHIIRGTPMAEKYAAEPWNLGTLDDSAAAMAILLERLPPETVILRLGATCPSDLLVAPEWLNNRQELIRKVSSTLADRNSYQGRFGERTDAKPAVR